jgi:hypothetical protein
MMPWHHERTCRDSEKTVAATLYKEHVSALVVCHLKGYRVTYKNDAVYMSVACARHKA